MKKLLAINIILLISNAVFSQDLIITNGNDSLNCVITKVDKDFLYFTYNNDGETLNSIISREEVKSYYFSYSEKPILSQEQINALYPPPAPQWRIALRGGYNRAMGSTKGFPDAERKYLNDLKNGFNIGTDVNYFFNNEIGIGAKYTYYKNKNEDVWLGYKDNMNYHFIAPSFIVRGLDRTRKNTFILDMAIGYLSFRNAGYAEKKDITLRAKTVGIHFGFVYERSLSKNVAIGGGLSYLSAFTSRYDVTEDLWRYTIELDAKESLSHFDISLYLVFNASKK